MAKKDVTVTCSQCGEIEHVSAEEYMDKAETLLIWYCEHCKRDKNQAEGC